MFFFGFLTLALGLVFGSFVGAITYRIPRGKSFTKGRSNCDGCGNQISWYDNIPLLSFLILKGKCRHCSQKISIRYPIIEVFVAILFLLVYFAPHFCNSF
ncbi:MAG: prepilin peptidase, partial [Microgenomates group bacterium]